MVAWNAICGICVLFYFYPNKAAKKKKQRLQNSVKFIGFYHKFRPRKLQRLVSVSGTCVSGLVSAQKVLCTLINCNKYNIWHVTALC